MSYNWILLSGLAALSFGVGDFVAVFTGHRDINIILLFTVYCVIIGVVNAIYLLFFRTDAMQQITNFDSTEWFLIIAFSGLYYFAYITHFVALNTAPNAGLANALVMFHVVILTLLAYFVLMQSLNWQTVLGIIITFIGAALITVYSNV